MNLEELENLERRLYALENELVAIRSDIVARKHKLQGPKRAGLYPGQLDNVVDQDTDPDECNT
jgi:hypothetical protein